MLSVPVVPANAIARGRCLPHHLLDDAFPRPLLGRLRLDLDAFPDLQLHGFTSDSLHTVDTTNRRLPHSRGDNGHPPGSSAPSPRKNAHGAVPRTKARHVWPENVGRARRAAQHASPAPAPASAISRSDRPLHSDAAHASARLSASDAGSSSACSRSQVMRRPPLGSGPARSRGRCRDAMMMSGPIASSGTNARSSSTARASSGVCVRTAASGPLGAGRSARRSASACSAKRNAWRGGVASSTIATTLARSRGLRSRCSPPWSQPDRPIAPPFHHAPRPIASAVQVRRSSPCPLAA